MELSIIFPVHNEAEGIENFLSQVSNNLDKLTISYEILCVENGSTDQSLAILQYLAKKYSRLKVLESSKGWGNAVRKGISNAIGKYTLYMVSDYQIDPKYIVSIYMLFKHSHVAMAKAWRTNRENKTRLVNSRSYNFIANLLFGVGSRDINATPKLLETKLLQSIPLTSHNIAIDLELLLKLKKRGLTWLELPIPSNRRKTGKSTTNLKAVWEMVSYMLKFRFGNL